MDPSSNIVLTGFMGTGKTTVGRLLAAELGFEFVDTDTVIEDRYGPIAAVFAERGEATFRAIEREVAAELTERIGLVVATGGRMMLDDDNVASLGRTGRVFCLVAEPDEIHRRVVADAARIERPLLAGPDPRSRIIELMAERRDAYERFTQIATDDRTPGVIVAEIVAHLAAGAADDATGPALSPAAGSTVRRDACRRVVDMTDSTYDAIAGNRDYAADFPAGHLDVRPSRRLAVVTCMDSRIDVHAALGLELGEAHVIRNAGGVVTDDVVRSVCLSQLRLGTNEILVIHHTDCGIQGVEDDEILAEIEGAFGERPSWRIHAFTDAAEDVRRSMKRLAESPFLTLTEAISGYVFDVDTGRLEPVAG